MNNKKIYNTEVKKSLYVKKIQNEDKKVISNFHMIKLSDILKIKETIRTLEKCVNRCGNHLKTLRYQSK